MYEHYKKILICVDGSEVSREIFEQGIEIAVRNEAHVYVIKVIDTRSWPSLENYAKTADQIQEDALKQVEKVIGEYKAASPDHPIYENLEVIVEAGSPRSVITKKIAPRVQADLIICGATSIKGIDAIVVGSVANQIVRTSPCDVLVVHPKS